MDDPRPVRLRPHHILCLRTFIGKGYDEAFVDNMYEVQDRIEERGAVIQLVKGCDDICVACPHRTDEACEFGASVDRKDTSVLSFLDLIAGTSIIASELGRMLEDRLQEISDIRDVCSECDWNGLCNDQLGLEKDAHR